MVGFCCILLVVFHVRSYSKTLSYFKPSYLLSHVHLPRFLRTSLFGRHEDLKYAGLCRPLRTPHHLGDKEKSPFREGIVTKQTVAHPLKERGTVSLVDGRMSDGQCIVIDRQLEPGKRVTVRMSKSENSNKHLGTVVTRSTPLEEHGIYWGFSTRFASDIGAAIEESPYEDGYDVIIGTSDKGDSVYEDGYEIPKFDHLLIVFGGPNGLESCMLKQGEGAPAVPLEKPRLLFDQYINCCPFQGTRTIRTEEAMMMTLSVLQPFVQNNYRH